MQTRTKKFQVFSYRCRDTHHTGNITTDKGSSFLQAITDLFYQVTSKIKTKNDSRLTVLLTNYNLEALTTRFRCAAHGTFRAKENKTIVTFQQKSPTNSEECDNLVQHCWQYGLLAVRTAGSTDC